MVKSILALAALSLATLAGAHGGLVVDSVIDGSPAAAAGLRAGDRLARLDGRDLPTFDDLQQVLAGHTPGDTVSLAVRRGDENVDLTLTLGARPDGGASIGVMLAVAADHGAGPEQPAAALTECREWIEKTYRIDALMRDLQLDLSEDYETILACVARNMRGVPPAKVLKYCDPIFKVHCSSLDLLADIGEAQARRCEVGLERSLGVSPARHKAWTTCARRDVVDRYMTGGETSDETACRASFLDRCGTNIDSLVEAGDLSTEQRDFVECCSTDALDSQPRADRCAMLDDGFSRGPCLDRSACLNRLTAEWIRCPAAP